MKPPKEGRYVPLLAASVVVVLMWFVSFADPCLIAAARGGPLSSANPIAVTSCEVFSDRMVITRGDAILRVGALATLMGLFGIVGGLWDSTRSKRSVAGISAIGSTCAFALYAIARHFVFNGNGNDLGSYLLATWAICVVVGSLASVIGVAIAATTVSE